MPGDPDTTTRVLAGDLGGTKVLLAIVRWDGERLEPQLERRYDSAAWPTFEAVADDFRQAAGPTVRHLDAACLAIAGPVTNTRGRQRATLTNRPWHLDGRRIARRLQVPRLTLINDLQGAGEGLQTLGRKDSVTLQAGTPQRNGPCAVIGLGTGFGASYQAAGAWHPTEAGHADLAATDASQAALIRHLAAAHHRVAVEHVLSGPGLVRVYEFLREHRGAGPPMDRAAAVTRALADGEPLARDTVELFVRILGAQAGNLALAYLPTGGVFLWGGLTPHLLPVLKETAFLDAFTAKGPMTGLMGDIPVIAVTNPRLALLGAAHHALRTTGFLPPSGVSC